MENVFLVHTPYQAKVVVCLIRHLSISKATVFCEGRQLYGFFLNSLHELDLKLTVRPLWPVSPRDFGFHGRRNHRENFLNVLEVIGGSCGANIYLSDINWPINNEVFFKFGRSSNLYIYEEGLGNYIAKKRGVRECLRGFLRWVTYFVHLGPYFRPYIGEQMGGDRREVAGQFLFRPDLCSSSGRCIKISSQYSPNGSHRLEEKSFVFLDQPVVEAIGASRYLSVIKESLGYFKGLGYTCYFKRHHFSKFKNAESLDFDGVLTSSLSIEDFFINEDAVFLSFTSSALLNLKLLYGDSVICYSAMANEVLAGSGFNSNDNKKVKDIFTEAGVLSWPPKK